MRWQKEGEEVGVGGRMKGWKKKDEVGGGRRRRTSVKDQDELRE